MEDQPYSSAYYGSFTIRASSKVHNSLSSSTVEELAALVFGAAERPHLSNSYKGNPGDGAEAYVHNSIDHQIASVMDVNMPPDSVTVLNTGRLKGGQHVWD